MDFLKFYKPIIYAYCYGIADIEREFLLLALKVLRVSYTNFKMMNSNVITLTKDPFSFFVYISKQNKIELLKLVYWNTFMHTFIHEADFPFCGIKIIFCKTIRIVSTDTRISLRCELEGNVETLASMIKIFEGSVYSETETEFITTARYRLHTGCMYHVASYCLRNSIYLHDCIYCHWIS